MIFSVGLSRSLTSTFVTSSKVVSTSDLCNPMDCTVHEILQARILEWVAFRFSRDLPNWGIEPRSPTLQADSLPAEPQEKTKNTGVGSLSLLQRNLPDPGVKPGSPALQMDSLPTELWGKLPSLHIFSPGIGAWGTFSFFPHSHFCTTENN